jgi:hypothetical protein
MPYITPKDRERFEPELSQMSVPNTAGELNYLFSEIIDRYLGKQGLNYQHINDCIGALEGAKLELYRRIVIPYEDTKIFLNSDVYQLSMEKLGDAQHDVCVGKTR